MLIKLFKGEKDKYPTGIYRKLNNRNLTGDRIHRTLLRIPCTRVSQSDEWLLYG